MVARNWTHCHLLDFLLDSQLDGVRDKFGAILDNIPNPFLFEIIKLILLQEESDLGTTTSGRIFDVQGDCEGSSSESFPGVLFVSRCA